MATDLNKSKIRLLRDDWSGRAGGANVLAEELYAILGDDGSGNSVPGGAAAGGGGAGGATGGAGGGPGGAAGQTFQSPTFVGYGTQPAASFLQFANQNEPQSNDNLAPLVLNFGGDAPFTLDFSGGVITLTLDASISGNFEFPQSQTVPVEDGRIKLPAAREVFMGKVVSGSGDTYMVSIFPDGPSQPFTGTTVEVKQMQINPAETIPPGTYAIVVQDGWDVQKGKLYSMQVPVWL